MTEITSDNDLNPIAENVWLVDAGEIHAAGLPLPLRMTVIRLAKGDLILHSPTRYSRSLRDKLQKLGRITYLLAPSIAHWMFLPDWQSAIPEAQVMAVVGLGRRSQVRQSGLRIDAELDGNLPEAWSGQLDTVLISAPPFAELALFHRSSRTLVLTDLVQNLDRQTIPPLPRLFADQLGITAPDGRAPIYLRLLLRIWGNPVSQAAARLVSFAPDRVVFSHGEWFAQDATARLRQSLQWLLPREASPNALQLRDMRGLRVVITGASSGIGLATARAFAQRGASLTLAARREAMLDEVAAECVAAGGRAIVVTTDVTDSDAVAELARRADEAYGGIDVWINNAGTGVFGPYHKGEMQLHRKTIEVNLLGSMHGAYAVLPIFLRQHKGILINNISLGGWAPTPFAAAYTASKFGLRGFTASLRQELSSQPRIHVCAVFPSIIDTPGFIHGANVSGRNLDPGSFLYRSDEVAETFVSVVKRPRDEVAVGWPARAGQLSYAALRAPTERIVAAAFHFLLARAKPAAVTSGAMIEPIAQGTAASGDWLARKQLPSASVLTMVAIGTALAMFGLALAHSAKGMRRRAATRARMARGARQSITPTTRASRAALDEVRRARNGDAGSCAHTIFTCTGEPYGPR